MSTKKYLILSTALAGGGAENVARLMAENMPKAVCVLFANSVGVAIKRCPVYTVPNIIPDNRLFAIPKNILRLVVIQIHKIIHRPSVTISHLEGPNFANLMTIGGGKRIIFVHNTVLKNYAESRLTNRVKQYLVRRLYHRAYRVVGVSSDICKELVREFGVDEEKAIFVANPIDISRITNLSVQNYGDWRDKLLDINYVINIASLTKQKNHELLLNVFYRLRKKYADLTLVLVGQGEQELAIRTMCSRLGFTTNTCDYEEFDDSVDVYFLGYQLNPFPLLARSRLFILTSLWEGLPISLLEALALGRPCVSSNSSSGVRRVLLGHDELQPYAEKQKLIRTNCGIIVNEDLQGEHDYGNWMEAAMELLSDAAVIQRCAEARKERANEYDINKIRNVWLELTLNP